MNHTDRKVIGELVAKVERTHEDIQDIKKDIKVVIDGQSKQGEKLVGLNVSFKNHLKHHIDSTQATWRRIKIVGIIVSGVIGFIALVVSVT